MIRWASVLVLAACAASPCALAQVELRSHERIDASVVDATLAGVRIASEGAGAEPRLVSWDRVKRVEGAMAAKAQTFEGVADKLWRARTRIERGDLAGAEPLCDELAQVYIAEHGPSASVVAECLIRCRLGRGAQGAATAAWLWWTTLQEQRAAAKAPERFAWVGGGTDLGGVVDPGMGLAPSLPPIWAPGASTNAAATSPEWARFRARTGLAAEFADLYEKGARFEAGLETEVQAPDGGSNAPGMSLVREIVISRAGDAEAREAARVALQHRLDVITARPDPTRAKAPVTPRWVEAWCRIALGRSLIRETDTSMKMRGVIELLHLPARFASEQPYLAGLALADAAVTMSEAGDDVAASALKGELESKFPTHPMTRWERLTKIKNTQQTSRPAPGV